MNPDKIRSILNTLFLIGVLVTILTYFLVEDKTLYFYIGGGTMFVKIAEFFIRFTNR